MAYQEKAEPKQSARHLHPPLSAAVVDEGFPRERFCKVDKATEFA
jgi:hypothetical protein